MKRAILGAILIHCAGWLAFGQSTDARPKFTIADVQVSAKTVNQGMRTVPVHDGRYELKNASMLDLVRTAYSFDADKVLGGPSWLEMDRFDIAGKLPDGSTPDDQKLMLQALLEDRFKLVVHKDTKPLPGYALTVGKKPQLKEASGSEESGCKIQTSSGPAPEGGVRLMASINGVATTLALGPGMTLQYNCRNMTMAAFAEGLRGMMGANLGTSPVSDKTGLAGHWNFDVSWSLQINGPAGASTSERVTIFDAVDKQLRLKLEETQVPTPVIVVDSVNREPSADPPGVAEALPPIPPATEFEVASVKPTEPGSFGMGFSLQPGGRVNVRGMPMRMLITFAFNDPGVNRAPQVTGAPKWADTERFDIVAKAPSDTAPLDMNSAAVPLRALLVDRFKMTYHTEQQPQTAYSLEAAKPKMKKADPNSRTSCKSVYSAPGAPAGMVTITCQNITMAQFADRLSNMPAGLSGPVADATGIEGGWDLSLTYSAISTQGNAGGAGAAVATPSGIEAPAAADPTGGYTIAEALEKQLGLKLVAEKRPMPAIVIDHIEEKPTDN